MSFPNVYRDIRLLKAHLYSRSFSSNCVGDAAPKHSSGCGFVLTIICHTSTQGLICAMRIPQHSSKDQLHMAAKGEQSCLKLMFVSLAIDLRTVRLQRSYLCTNSNGLGAVTVVSLPG